MANSNKDNFDHKVSLEQTRLSKRWPSWLLFVGILSLFLIIPLLSLGDKDLAKTLRNSPLPSDNSWISGDLSPPHQIPDLNKNCDACHANGFEVVQDTTCLSCHAATNHHFDINKHDVAKLENSRCASCHLEHEDPLQIVRQDDQLCVACHNDMAETGVANTDLIDVDSFGSEQKLRGTKKPHPAFKVSMLQPNGLADQTIWETVRVALADSPKEQSNLVFPHDVHLAPDGIDAPEGQRILQCNSCHLNDDAGELMQPINMVNHCSDCHTMVFDETAPDRVVPHGDPDTVLLTLEEYYSRQFLLAELGREPTAQEVKDFMLRRPGKAVVQREQQQQTLASPWGKANSVAKEIFEQTTCKTCHETSIDDSGKHLSKWRVNPIRLTTNWMPKSDFDHLSHKTFACASCHNATSSEDATDVLMPDLASCEACHTGSRTHENKLPTTCIGCHEFHLPDQAPWGKPTDSAALRLNNSALMNGSFAIKGQHPKTDKHLVSQP